MRRVYVRETEHRVTDSMYELPDRIEGPDPSYLYQSRGEPLGFFGWCGILICAVAFLVVIGAICTAAQAQSNVRQFYGWTDYGGSKGATVNIYPQVVQPQPVPIQPSGQMQCSQASDGTTKCQMQACGIGPDFQWHCQ